MDRFRLPFRQWAIAAATAVMMSTPALAQTPVGQGPLKWQLVPVSRARSHAPATFDLTLHWEQPQLLEGRLELTIQIDGRPSAEFRADDLTLLEGTHRIRFSIPPLHVPADESRIVALARFVTAEREFRLEPIEPYLPAYWRRSFVIGVPHVEGRGVTDYQTVLLSSLHVERFNPDDTLRVGLTTYPARLDPRDFSEHGLAYCQFDLLLLEGEGFRNLRPEKLDAIFDWVEAGGSVCVAPGRIVDEPHVQFLNRLAGADATAPVYLRDNDGNLLKSGPRSRLPFATYRTGLGRTVVLHRPLHTAEIDAPSWRRAVAFLWKIRSDQVQRIAKTGTWVSEDDRRQDSIMLRYGVAAPFRHVPLPQIRQLRQYLIPRSIQGVPLPVVAGILIVFLLVAAPGDYYLLGRLGCRRYTWVVFPVVSLAFTLLTVRLARSHLAKTDYRQAVVFVDLAEGNRVVRASRFELLMLANERTVRWNLQQSVFLPLEGAASLDGDPTWAWQSAVSTGAPSPNVRLATGSETERPSGRPPIYRGRMPTAYTVEERMRQWSPRLARLTTLTTQIEVPPVDWSMLGELDLARPEDRLRFERAVKRVEPTARLIFLNGPSENKSRFIATRGRPNEQDATANFIAGLVRAASSRPETGWFGVVSQLAPNAAGNFEDLSLLDPSDENQWLIVILVKRGPDWIAFRRLHREEQ